MAASIDQSGSVSDNGVTSLATSFGTPPGASQLIVCVLNVSELNTAVSGFTPPSGFTERVAVSALGTNGGEGRIFTGVGDDSTTVFTFSWTGSNGASLAWFSLDGADKTDPLRTSATATSVTSVTSQTTGTTLISGITGDWAVGSIATDSQHNGYNNAWTNGYTQRWNLQQGGSPTGRHSSTGASLQLASDGTQETTETWSQTRQAWGMIMVVRAEVSSELFPPFRPPARTLLAM